MDDIPDEKILLIRKFGLIIFENDGIVFQKSIRIIKRKGIHSLSVKKAIIIDVQRHMIKKIRNR